MNIVILQVSSFIVEMAAKSWQPWIGGKCCLGHQPWICRHTAVLSLWCHHCKNMLLSSKQKRQTDQMVSGLTGVWFIYWISKGCIEQSGWLFVSFGLWRTDL